MMVHDEKKKATIENDIAVNAMKALNINYGSIGIVGKMKTFPFFFA